MHDQQSLMLNDNFVNKSRDSITKDRMLASIISFAMGYGLLRITTTIVTFTLIIIHTTYGYEKTLRKIVRNQSKMVQRPFSEPDTGSMSQSLSWKNKSLGHQRDAIIVPGFSHISAKVHKVQIQRPKVTTIVSSVETNRGKSSHFKTFTNHDDIRPNELRQTRHTNGTIHYEKEVFFVPKNSSINEFNINIEQFYKIPPSKFFPPIDDHDLQSLEQKSNSKENTIIIPEIPKTHENVSTIVKGIFIGSQQEKKTGDDNSKVKMEQVSTKLVEVEPDQDKADFLLLGAPLVADNYRYNSSVNPYICSVLKETRTNIDSQRRFTEFDIEPYWGKRKHFWDSIYDSRYESLMRSMKWPPLKVILLPRTHVDSIWKKTFNQYHNDSVGKILSNIIKKLQFYGNLTFTWNEVSHLSRWWDNATPKTRLILKKLLKSGRLEITTGAWVEPEESTTHLFGLVHLLVEGLEWLKCNLNYSPKVGWLTNTVTHSPTVTYLLSASDIWQLIITNVHYSWEQYFAEYQISDFVWTQNWDDDKFSNTELNKVLKVIGNDRYSKHSVLTHYIPFNSAGFKACGPNSAICSNDFNFVNSNKNLDINSYNVKDKSELILEQYSKTGTLSSHNVIIAPLGGPYLYERQAEFDFQYNNYEKIADFINVNRGIYKASIEFGTAKDYFESILSDHNKYQTLKGDFLNFADVSSGTPAYWAGFYTSRPFLKIMLRRLESTLRTTELLFSFALNFNTYRNENISSYIDDVISARENVARLLDRNVVSGTIPANVLRHVHNEILKTVNRCWQIQEMAGSLLTSKPEFNKPYLQKYVYREGEFISTFKTVSPDDQIYLFNSLSQERTEIVELITRHPNVIIMDHNKKEITVQINPVWKYSSDNILKISRRFYKINFVVVIPPMTLELFKIKETYDATHSAGNIYCSSCIVDDVANGDSVFPFDIQPIQTGDIQLESYKHRLIFDEQTGFLKTVIEKATNVEKNVMIDFGAFKDANVNSGVFLFNTNVSKPLYDILLPYRVGKKTKITLIVSGQILTEISTIYGRLLQHTVRIVNLQNNPLSSAIYLESKVDYEVSPKNRELELFMSVQTDISNGNSPEIITDNNGYQHTARVLNISRRVESNMYPITSMAFIQDEKSRLTYITDHAQGITALQEGQIIVMLDRRVLFNDGRGSNEGLGDSSATCHRQYILLENFEQVSTTSELDDTLPSLTAAYLAKTLNYLLDIFIVDRNKTNLAHYSFLPLVKTSFPCDVSVLNYRSVLRERTTYNSPNSALLILHRRSITCSIHSTKYFNCNGDSTFSIDKIMRNIRAVYKTNLPGTSKGTPLLIYNLSNFPPMEIITLKIYF